MSRLLRSILAATDLGDGSDAIVRSAAMLAARSGAKLHLIHSLELPWVPADDVMHRTGFFGQIQDAEDRLRAQAKRAVPDGGPPPTMQVIVYLAHKAILDRARSVAADLIVLGPHRGSEAGAHFLGTTADRVIRTSEVPCLVVRDPLPDNIWRIGVPLDYSDPSQGALETALAWSIHLGGDAVAPARTATEVRVMYVGWPVEKADDPNIEEKSIRPRLHQQVESAASFVSEAEGLEIGIDVVWSSNAAEATAAWAKQREIELLVMATHGRSGIRRALMGSVASGVARRTPCPVLLVPPSIWSGKANNPRLERVLIATDFSDTSLAAAKWSLRDLAPEAEHLVAHVLEVPEPPPVLAGRYGLRPELLRTARAGAQARLEKIRSCLDGSDPQRSNAVRLEVREGQPAEQIVELAENAGADLVVMGEHGRTGKKRGTWTLLGSTAERVLRASRVPVIVARGAERGPPRNLLVAVDGSEASLWALRWADFLRGRFGGSLTALFVETPMVYSAVGGAAINLEPAADLDTGPYTGWTCAREQWLREQLDRAGVASSEVSVCVSIGSPPVEIVAEQERSGADLIAVGTHGRGTLGRTLLGSVAGAVLRTASCPVLVVGDPERTGA